MPLMLYWVLNSSSHPFEDLKCSSSITAATATAFACNMGPERRMFLLRAILHHSNIAESISWNLHTLALLLAPFPLQRIYQAVSACHEGWIESEFYNIETSLQFPKLLSLNFCLCRLLLLLFLVKFILSVSFSSLYRMKMKTSMCSSVTR